MNFYEVKMTTNLIPEDKDTDIEDWCLETGKKLNKLFGYHFDEEEACSALFWDLEPRKAGVLLAVDAAKTTPQKCLELLAKRFVDNYPELVPEFEGLTEITTARFNQLGNRGENVGYIRHFRNYDSGLRLDFHDDRSFHVKESMVPEGAFSRDEALEAASNMMADSTLLEEIERIYSEENEKCYLGNPVHYKINACNMDAAMETVELLARALKANGRLGGGRITKLYEITENCYEETNFDNMFAAAAQNILVFDLDTIDGSDTAYANLYDRVIRYFAGHICRAHINTLCFFVESTAKASFSHKLLARIAEDIDIVEIKEGSGNKEQAIEYLMRVAAANQQSITREEILEILPDKNLFTVKGAYELYDKWFRNGLKTRVYKAYRNVTCVTIENGQKVSEPYEKLQKMIGLSEMKETVDTILDHARIQKLRAKMGFELQKTSMHMIFTGNPGSAKTTVARLLAQILRKEGVLETGDYVECGRADLVGKYVGWTAKTVRAKFREARGGVLFIDEAYSLVDGSHSFGEEAINTIVQEMENHKDDVIVIFAGYPEKMKEFLDANEGLRSRIAFHLEFPDYNAYELVEILKLMAKEKGYRLEDGVEQKCLGYFAKACRKPEFGNGRFVRNLLDQAIMAQAARLTREYHQKKISRKAMVLLKPEDFEVNAGKNLEKEIKGSIGFAV